MPGGILLATINAKWIHPSLALRLLKANLGPLESRCEIAEFALRQPLREKAEPILAAQPRILGISVSIWNHTATIELLKELHEAWKAQPECQKPLIVLGGPEASYLPPDAAIFTYADYCICGEGEIAFASLCKAIYIDGNANINDSIDVFKRFQAKKVFSETGKNFSANLAAIKTGYHLYTDEDLRKKLTYVEASRGCPYRCEFCKNTSAAVREFPLQPFFAEMDDLISRGARTLKFLDRTFNLDISRAVRIMGYFLDKIKTHDKPLTVHFEMVPSRFPPELLETIALFPAGSLRLEVGIQTLNTDVSARIGRPADPAGELETLRILRDKTSAIIHADLIAGLPGEDTASFGKGFDLLWAALENSGSRAEYQPEIQLGILKLLPGAAIARHTKAFGMRYNLKPPYEVIETAAMPEGDLARIKNFARFWELTVNRGILNPGPAPVFDRFMSLSDSLLIKFGKNWGIPKNELLEAINEK